MEFVPLPVTYFLFRLGITYLGGWAIVATGGK
jgi:hypothetical protein